MDFGNPVTTPLEITLSIVSHGDSARIRKLLDSIDAAEPARHFHIILTDNFGRDLPDMASTEKRTISVIRNTRPQGFGKNHNQAFRRAQGTFFCILNPDVLFMEPVFNRLTSELAGGQADLIAPLLVDSHGSLQDSFRRLPEPVDLIRRRLPGYHFTPIPAQADGFIHPDWMAGMFLLLKSETFRSLNGFDERYYMYFEDVDLCTRAKLRGLKLAVDPHLHLCHDAQRASRRSATHLLWHVQSALRFYSSAVYRKAVNSSRHDS